MQPWLMSDTPGQSSKNSSEDSSCEQLCMQDPAQGPGCLGLHHSSNLYLETLDA